ncbi:MAG: hypothetical protein Q9167_007956 [Letrouitia subvulpina]
MIPIVPRTIRPNLLLIENALADEFFELELELGIDEGTVSDPPTVLELSAVLTLELSDGTMSGVIVASGLSVAPDPDPTPPKQPVGSPTQKPSTVPQPIFHFPKLLEHHRRTVT